MTGIKVNIPGHLEIAHRDLPFICFELSATIIAV